MPFFNVIISIGETMKNALKKLDYPLLIATLVLSAFGLLMIFSASSVSSVLQYGSTEYHFFTKQLLSLGVALLAAVVIILIPIKKYQPFYKLILVIMGILLIMLRTYGSLTNSAQSWFRFLNFSIQPSEFTKPAIILFLACSYGKIKKFKNIYDVFIPMIPCVILCGLIALEPDLGTASIIAAICMFIFFTLPLSKNKQISILKTAVIAIIVSGVIILNTNPSMLTSSQASRFNFLNPCSRYLQETGYQVCNGYIAIHNGGLFGVGLGNSTQKFLYLPESHTDFIFPIIVEELGLIGGFAVFVAYIFILYRILIIARNTTSLRGSIIAFGTFSYILVHIIVNMGGLLALIPLTGVPLPFLSYGGSNLISLFILLGLTQRVCIENKSTKKVQ